MAGDDHSSKPPGLVVCRPGPGIDSGCVPGWVALDAPYSRAPSAERPSLTPHRQPRQRGSPVIDCWLGGRATTPHYSHKNRFLQYNDGVGSCRITKVARSFNRVLRNTRRAVMVIGLGSGHPHTPHLSPLCPVLLCPRAPTAISVYVRASKRARVNKSRVPCCIKSQLPALPPPYLPMAFVRCSNCCRVVTHDTTQTASRAFLSFFF